MSSAIRFYRKRCFTLKIVSKISLHAIHVCFKMKSVLFLFVWFYIIVSVCCQDTANTNATVLTVSGTGSVSVPNDHVDVGLTIENDGQTAVVAQQKTTNSVNRVLTSLQTYNISNLQTSGMSLQPRYNYSDPATPLLGFQSSSTITYSAPADIAGDTLDAVVRGGAIINYVNTAANDTAINDAYIQSLNIAAIDARKKADSISNSVGMCLGFINSVNVEPGSIPGPTPTIMYAEATMSSSASKSTIVPGENKISSNVDITYQLVQC